MNQIHDSLEQDQLVLLTWPRQVGKTTLMHDVAQLLNIPHIYINCEDTPGKERTSKQAFLNHIQFEHGFDPSQTGLLLLDEVQYMNNSESLLKALYDDPKVVCYIIATWSRLRGQSKVWSTLVWRGEIIPVWTFSFEEFLLTKWKTLQNISHPSYDLLESYVQEYLSYGGYPQVVYAPTHQAKVKAFDKIMQRFVQKDVLAFFNLEQSTRFTALLQYISKTIWSQWKTSKYAGNRNISIHHTKKYLKFLEDSYLIHKVDVYAQDFSKRHKTLSEYFFHDIGLISYYTNQRDTDDHKGKRIENLVWRSCIQSPHVRSISYRRNKYQSEIDFVLELYTAKIVGIEVKSENKMYIPQSFPWFIKNHDNIQHMVITSKSEQKKSEINNTTIYRWEWRRIEECIDIH